MDDFASETTLDDAIDAFMAGDAENDLEQGDDVTPDAEADEDEAEDQEELEFFTDEDEEDDTSEDEDEEPSDEDDEDADEEEEDEAPALADDEAEVEVEVGEERKRVKVSELKSLFGQKENLSAQTSALAEQRRVMETQGIAVAKLLEDRYTRAKEQADKYKNVDLFKASRELDDEDFDALRAAKEAADTELQAVTNEANNFMKTAQETRASMIREQAKVARQEIMKAIPEWNDELYSQIRTYAVAQGMDVQTVNELVDPSSILLIHKAMQFDNAQKAQPKVTKKVRKAPTKAAKKSSKVTDTKTSKMKAKRRTAMESGDVDDVAELFMAAAQNA